MTTYHKMMMSPCPKEQKMIQETSKPVIIKMNLNSAFLMLFSNLSTYTLLSKLFRHLTMIGG